jgi:hypothetical protein
VAVAELKLQPTSPATFHRLDTTRKDRPQHRLQPFEISQLATIHGLDADGDPPPK